MTLAMRDGGFRHDQEYDVSGSARLAARFLPRWVRRRRGLPRCSTRA